jgi:hypothetical protein
LFLAVSDREDSGRGTDELRNLFDQYCQAENRVTHALLSALNEDRRLLRLFLRDLVKAKPPVDARKLAVLEQQYPGEEEPSEEELDRRGIPDGWIAAEEQAWCVLIESKVLASLRAAQIESHRRTAARRGFTTVIAVAITPHRAATPPQRTVMLEWRDIYAWLRHADSVWAGRAADYLEIVEAKLIEAGQLGEGTLTMFSGFPFGRDHPYTYLEGKRLLGLALGELRARRDLRQRLGMNPKDPGRPAITGSRDEGVWNFLSLSSASDAAKHTHYPHLTLSIGAWGVGAMVTVPNAVNSRMRQHIKALGQDGFHTLVKQIVRNMKPLLREYPGVAPWFGGLQRRWPSLKAIPYVDATIGFDLRTAGTASEGPKPQLRWLEAGYGSFINKQGSNYEIQLGAIFRYERCPELRHPNATDLIARAWLACGPLVNLGRQ